MKQDRILESSNDEKSFNERGTLTVVRQADGLLEALPAQERQKRLISEDQGEEVLNYLSPVLEESAGNALIVKTSQAFNIGALSNRPHSLINLKKVNDIRKLNAFFAEVNARLPEDGIFVGRVETKNQRKARLLKKYPPVLNGMYYFGDFVFKRVMPKLPVFRGLYYLLTAGRNHPLSKAEALGRLVYNGFAIESTLESNNHLYFTARKESSPSDAKKPSTGPLLTITRIGRNGKPIKVFKLRTMHPYAEYLQQYVYETNALDKGGKFRNDFRISGYGRFMRRLWIDELPMIWNLLRGDMKLVGVRPISRHYLSLYNDELKQERLGAKPGLIPPFYADLPTTLDEIMESELKYLRAHRARPFRTDCKYLGRALRNIIFRKARSN